jgi:hypothetical protein
VDCSRWTEVGLKPLLAEGGFGLDDITTGAGQSGLRQGELPKLAEAESLPPFAREQARLSRRGLGFRNEIDVIRIN